MEWKILIVKRCYSLNFFFLSNILNKMPCVEKKADAEGWCLTLLRRPVLSTGRGDSGLLGVSGAGATEFAEGEPSPPPGMDTELHRGLLPLKNCLFSALNRSTLASRSRQSRRLSFRASCRRLNARSLAMTWESGMPNAFGADSEGKGGETGAASGSCPKWRSRTISTEGNGWFSLKSKQGAVE